MSRLAVGVIGGGLIAQVEHLPNLMALPDRFQVVGLADPSARVRDHLARRHGVEAFATAEALLDRRPDAVVVATPDAYHAELVLVALARGCHVFVEKPLCYSAAEATEIAAARDRAGRVVQVGYMKRFDPAVRHLRQLLAARPGPLRSLVADVVDSDFWAFVAHRDFLAPDDVPPALVAEAGARRAAQVAAALGFVPDTAGLKGFAGPYCSSLVHDLNLSAALLEPLGARIGAPLGAAFFAGDGGGYIAARLAPGEGLMNLTWTAAPRLAHYSERLSLVFDDARYALEFPSPYLNHHPTRLTEWRSEGQHLIEIAHRPSYAEPFVEELKAWHDAVTEEAPVVNTVEQAGEDMALFAEFGRLALGSPAR
jgi:predicted dehydrogenase